MKPNLKLHLLLSLCTWICNNTINAQSCTGLSVTYISSESRCVSTGSIQINVSGGSGNYEYKVSGPLVTAFTSSNNITGLLPGKYLVTIHDLINNCTYQNDSITVAGSYITPAFTLTTTTASCGGVANGSILLTSQQFGRNPILYQIV
ncbi:MAG: hypothetical protein HYX40_10290 [Sphingobacteriales bacterium]|nr:hypothetical protein [Sphingobacteriales bacterium]